MRRLHLVGAVGVDRVQRPEVRRLSEWRAGGVERHEHIVAGRYALGRDDLFLDGCGEQRRGVDDRTDVEVYDEGDR